MVLENIQQERKQSTLPFIFFVAEKKKNVCEEVSEEEPNN